MPEKTTTMAAGQNGGITAAAYVSATKFSYPACKIPIESPIQV